MYIYSPVHVRLHDIPVMNPMYSMHLYGFIPYFLSVVASVKVEDLQTSLDSLVLTSESELKKKQQDADTMMTTNTELQTQLEKLNQELESVQTQVIKSFIC